jgi:hypothetical protein
MSHAVNITSDMIHEYQSDNRALKVSQISYGAQKPLFLKRLHNSSNDFDMAINASASPVDFFIEAGIGEIVRVARWMLYIVDEKGFDVGNFASIGSPLSVGLKPFIVIDGIKTYLLDYEIKTTGDIVSISFDAQLMTFGNTDDIFTASWTFTETGQYVRLNQGDRLGVEVNDDLSGLSNFYIQAQGYYE